MSSLIEQAAQRLEQLKRAGVDISAAPAANTLPAAKQHAASPTPVSETMREVPPVISSRSVEIDLDALPAAGIVSPNSPRSTIADQFRVIKRPLIANAIGKGATVDDPAAVARNQANARYGLFACTVLLTVVSGAQYIRIGGKLLQA